MNPSTEDFVNAIESLSAEHIYLLPNNGNIILAAQQAADFSGRNVTVVPSRTIPQGLAAVLSFKDEGTAEVNAEAMNEAVLTGAVRPSHACGTRLPPSMAFRFTKAIISGFSEKTIVTASASLQETCKELLARMLEDGGELVTVSTGDQAKASDTAALTAWAKNTLPRCGIRRFTRAASRYIHTLSRLNRGCGR